MKSFLQTILRWLSKLILWKYRPTIVAITGSVGKTSAKDAVYAVLNKKFFVRKSSKNYNNEIGVPLTVIGSRSGGGNPLRWLWIFSRALFIFLLPARFPRVLVLEMGADRPGDITYLTRLAKPDVAVVTAVGHSHLKQFGSQEKIFKEKSELVKALSAKGTAVLNFDDELVQSMAAQHRGKKLFYGFDKEADLFATDLVNRPEGTIFKLHFQGNVVPVRLRGVCGQPHVYAALSAAAVGVSLNMNLVNISDGLGEHRGPPGRLRLLPGVKDTLIIDDSYNSAPASALAALEVLTLLPGKRKIAVLGDMAELGRFTEDGHRLVGTGIIDFGINWLITVGPKARFISDQALHMAYPRSSIMNFETADEAKKPVEKLLQPGDVILIKGSQVVRAEKIVREIMYEPHKAEELLCRQDPSWHKR